MGFAINTSASALKAFGTKMAVSANNVANVYSDDFKKSRALVTEGQNDAVKVDISKVDTGGPVETRMMNGEAVVPELSNTDLAGEFTDQIITQRAFEANTRTIQTEDQMLGTLLDIVG
ncbi:FlgG1 [Desulforapulum autotrophicum HRM2]|uniref:FlgG1 n=1 Tax=Desulforapulum autotrophicum (strain ATCC 43914 / DSM 3382 / VKM B-1955 / HRM2) TaxID=177437 RepID=C0QKS8_DESAH|nr:flagellar basal body rod C-terminal domain-containing protein [Desulforapulum autotrophicum]ACN16168.1 FlgG1 [Desulforapulum autotrophicum HRM2]